MKRKLTLGLSSLGLVLLLTVPLTWANQTKCVDCDGTECEWKVGNDYQVCTEFAGGNGCIAGGGACELD